MTGVLENMQAAILQLQELTKVHTGQIAQLSSAGVTVAGAATTLIGGGAAAANPFATPTPAAADNPFAAAGAAAATGTASGSAAVTGEQLTALIQPYLDNDAIKAQFGVQMRALGYENFPDIQPAHYGDMYARCQNVIEQAKQAGIIGGAAAAGTSII